MPENVSYNSPRQRVKSGAYMCNLYKQHNRIRTCTPHYITLKNLCDIVLGQIRGISEYVTGLEGGLEAFYSGILSDGAEMNQRVRQQELEKGRKRSGELDAILKRLFEQNALGVLSDERLVLLTCEYEEE